MIHGISPVSDSDLQAPNRLPGDMQVASSYSASIFRQHMFSGPPPTHNGVLGGGGGGGWGGTGARPELLWISGHKIVKKGCFFFFLLLERQNNTVHARFPGENRCISQKLGAKRRKLAQLAKLRAGAKIFFFVVPLLPDISPPSAAQVGCRLQISHISPSQTVQPSRREHAMGGLGTARSFRILDFRSWRC